jgi:hypothetical protein
MTFTLRRADCSRVLVAVLASATLIAFQAPPSHALALRATPGYHFLRIDHPRAGSTTGLTTIAENGDSAGFYTDAADRAHGFVRDAVTGAFADVDVPGAVDTWVLGLNAHGDVSGTFKDAAGAQHGFVRDASGLHTIDVPGAVSTTPATSEFGTGLGTAVGTIRDDGAVTGAWGTASGASHGFLLQPGHARVDLDAPGASTAMDPIFQSQGGTGAIRSNARGDVVGYFAPATRSSLSPVDIRAYRLRDGVWKTLLPSWAFTSQAFALNENGDAGGVSFGIDGLNGNGWIWQNGAFKRIDPAPLLLVSTVGDLSENGVLVGEMTTLDLKTHGYIAWPTG